MYVGMVLVAEFTEEEEEELYIFLDFSISQV